MGGSTDVSTVAQRKRAGPITQKSEDRNLPVLTIFGIEFLPFKNLKTKEFTANHTQLSGQIGTITIY